VAVILRHKSHTIMRGKLDLSYAPVNELE